MVLGNYCTNLCTFIQMHITIELILSADVNAISVYHRSMFKVGLERTVLS